MPKCECDRELQERVLRYIEQNRLTKSSAAQRLGLERTKLWRFCQTGRAHAETRAIYREALAREMLKTATRVAVEAQASTVERFAAAPALPSEKELKQIKKACEGLLALVCAYEAQLSRAVA